MTALVYGPGSRSGAALAARARAPLWLPDGGRQLLQPIHVFELAESIATLVERTGAARGSYELGGAAVARLAARLKGAPWCGLPSADVLRLPDRVSAPWVHAGFITFEESCEHRIARRPLA